MQAYFDAFSGIAGDMTVGALVDLGLEPAALGRALAALGLADVEVSTAVRARGPLHAVGVDVRARTPQPARSWATIRALLGGDALAPAVRDRALEAFHALARAEAAVHQVPVDHVHFHEVGAVDAIADIVGAALGFEALGIERAHVSPLPLGTGIVSTQHGPLPVPAPATVELLRDFVVRPGDGEGEMVTPTGAAILVGFGVVSGPSPALRASRVGYGAGTRELADRPNVLRIVLGEPAAALGHDEMVVIESNVDDMSPEIYEHAIERLLAAGAVDVALVPVHMKKGRPGVLLQILAPPARRDAVVRTVFAETTTIGVRFHRVERATLARRVVEVSTPFGPIAVKIAGEETGVPIVAPEYESCRAAAARHGVALRVVYDAARRAAG